MGIVTKRSRSGGIVQGAGGKRAFLGGQRNELSNQESTSKTPELVWLSALFSQRPETHRKKMDVRPFSSSMLADTKV